MGFWNKEGGEYKYQRYVFVDTGEELDMQKGMRIESRNSPRRLVVMDGKKQREIKLVTDENKKW